MKNKKHFIVIISISLFLSTIVFFVFSTGLGYLISDDTAELARRTASRTRIKNILIAIKKYHSDFNVIPDTLDSLVQEQYIEDSMTLIPSWKKDKEIRYQYFPNNVDDPNLILLSEDEEYIMKMKLRLRNIDKSIIQIDGFGEIIEAKLVSDKSGEYSDKK